MTSKKLRFVKALLLIFLTVVGKKEPLYAYGNLTKACSAVLSENTDEKSSYKKTEVQLSGIDLERIGRLESLIEEIDDYLKRDEIFDNAPVIENTNILKESLELAERKQAMHVNYKYRETNIKKMVQREGYSVEEALKKLGVSPEAVKYFDSNGNMIIKNTFQLVTENGDKVLDRIQIGFDTREIENSTLIFNDLVSALKKNKTLNLSVVINSNKIGYLEILLKTVPKNISKRITIVPHDGEVYLWARDGAKSLEIKKQPQVVSVSGMLVQIDGVDVKRSDYEKVSVVFSNNSNKLLLKSVFRFEGGDVIVGSENIFIGPRIVQAAMHDYGLSWEQAVYYLSLEYGKQVIPIFTIDRSRAPIPVKFHIDLAMTILRSKKTATEVVFVESPFELFKTLFGKELSIESTDSLFLQNIRMTINKRISEAKSGKPIALGELNLFKLLIKNRFEDHVKNELDSRLVVQTLKKHGYEVQLVPGIKVSSNNSNEYINWTNVVPLSPDSLLVPNYSIPKIDKAVYSIYKSHGYDVIPAHSSESTIKLNGGIRCVTNCY